MFSYVSNLFLIVSILSSALPEVFPLSNKRASNTSGGQLKYKTDLTSPILSSNALAWSSVLGKPSIKNPFASLLPSISCLTNFKTRS